VLPIGRGNDCTEKAAIRLNQQSNSPGRVVSLVSELLSRLLAILTLGF
jgi:hypothetical protein